MVLNMQARMGCTDSLIRVTAFPLNPPTTSHLRQPTLADSASTLCLREKAPWALAVFLHTAVLDPLSQPRANSIQATAALSGVCLMSSGDRSRDIQVKPNLCINSTGFSQAATTNCKSLTVSSKEGVDRTLCWLNLVVRARRPTCPVSPANPDSLPPCPTRTNKPLGDIRVT